MILLMSVFITDNRPQPKRFGLSSPSRYDLFRYTLASYSCIDLWQKCFFYIHMDDNYTHCRGELDEYIRELFPNPVIRWQRNERVGDWRCSLREEVFPATKDSPIWLATDDDHVFVDYNLDALHEVVNCFNDGYSRLKAIPYSHWAEHLCMAAASPDAQACGNVHTYQGCYWDSIQILTPEVLEEIWFHETLKDDDHYPKINQVGEKRLRQPLDVTYYVPGRELCRHFDGYPHADKGGLHNVTPPLSIPPGFFEGDVKILYCFKKRREGWVNINPLSQHYVTQDTQGADYKWMLEDLPLFWQGRISQIETDRQHSRKRLCTYRNRALAANLTTNKVNYRFLLPAVPVEWIEHQFRT